MSVGVVDGADEVSAGAPVLLAPAPVPGRVSSMTVAGGTVPTGTETLGEPVKVGKVVAVDAGAP